MTAVLVTRPQPDADELAKKLRKENFDVIIDPIFTIEFSATAPEENNCQALFATSRNAIRALCRIDTIKRFSNAPLFVVGEETEEMARQAGFKMVHAADHSAHSLAGLIAAACSPKQGPLLYLSGKTRKPELETELASLGFRINIWEGYSMRPPPAFKKETIDALREKQIGAVMLFSERASTHFLQLAMPLGDEALRHPTYICLSPQVAKPLMRKGLSTAAPSSPRLHAMIEMLPGINH
jgi:uroporphyrinogen-III synthase